LYESQLTTTKAELILTRKMKDPVGHH